MAAGGRMTPAPEQVPPARPLDRRLPGGRAYGGALALLGLLGVAGIGALVTLVASGPEPRSKWGSSAATLAFLLSTAGSAPPLAFASRMARGYWGIPLRRAADLFALSGLVVAPLLILLLFQLPDWRGRPSLWFDWPGAPLVWDSVAVLLLAALGLGLLYVSALPELAHSVGTNRRRGRLSLGWRGSARQWQVLPAGLILLGGLYLMVLVYLQLLVSSDLALSLVPGWGSAVVPAYQAISGLEGGAAATLLVLAALRRFGALRDEIGAAPFQAGGKLLLALALLWFYFVWSEFLTYWYGRTPVELDLLTLLMFGPMLVPFILSALLSFGLPVLLLIWNPIRQSVAGVTAVAGLVVAGTLVDRLRVYGAAWSVAGPLSERLAEFPPLRFPTLADVLVVVGLPAAVLFVYLLALGRLSALSAWEYQTLRLLRVERPYARTRVQVIAKPS